MSISQNHKYICFYYWDTAIHALNPYQKEYLPVEGFIWVERMSSTQIKLYYAWQMTIELTHTADPAHRVINAFKKAFNLARTSNGSIDVDYSLPPIPSSLIAPPPTVPPIYVSAVSVKKIP
tara:strand:+ start:21221 stop:21583 length:363 start_codon:yes stop_codon:yes gene_type:complete